MINFMINEIIKRSIPKKITSLHIFVISLMLLITNQFFSIGNRINSLLSEIKLHTILYVLFTTTLVCSCLLFALIVIVAIISKICDYLNLKSIYEKTYIIPALLSNIFDTCIEICLSIYFVSLVTNVENVIGIYKNWNYFEVFFIVLLLIFSSFEIMRDVYICYYEIPINVAEKNHHLMI